ncbi:MAG: hypothetical protein A2Y10_05955 [Planctomycetes bacterium GWF2_41_51]|nr:MAG: hypothetical protein A2Y10_05955 [Planctomycetes bacterium GWF2_41_51]
MLDEFKNFDITKCSDSELKVLIRQTLPILLQACFRVLNEKDTANQSPCNNCENRGHCNGCDLLESQLPSENTGAHSQIKYYGDLLHNIVDVNGKRQIKFDYADLKEIDRIRSDDIFTLYKNCSIIFSECEWRIATLKIRDGLTFKKISQIIGIAPSSASETFYRAKKKMEQYQKNKARKKA